MMTLDVDVMCYQTIIFTQSANVTFASLSLSIFILLTGRQCDGSMWLQKDG